MIDMNKKYRTRDGREVRIYATDGFGPDAVHGSVFYPDKGAWGSWSWDMKGRNSKFREHHSDLIEVKPRIQRTLWFNLYEKETYGPYRTKDIADRICGDARRACLKFEIDCEEGDGL